MLARLWLRWTHHEEYDPGRGVHVRGGHVGDTQTVVRETGETGEPTLHRTTTDHSGGDCWGKHPQCAVLHGIGYMMYEQGGRTHAHR